MPKTKLEPNKEYNCEISFALSTTSPNTGTPAIQITFDDMDPQNKGGTIDHFMYITPKTLEYAERDLITIGATKAELMSADFWDTIGNVLIGKKARIVTFEDAYNDKKTTKVKYIRKYGAAVSSGSNLSSSLAVMFGGKTKTPPVPVSEKDIPEEFKTCQACGHPANNCICETPF